MSAVEREYSYQSKWTLILGCIAFFALGAVVLAVKATRNQRGLLLEGVIELGPEGATRFYWGLAACGLGFVSLGAFLAYQRLRFRQRVALTATSLLVPKSNFSHEEIEIRYRDIEKLVQQSINGQHFLKIVRTSGKNYSLLASKLPSNADFSDFVYLLRQNWQAAQGTR
jgi:hypothetical protein